MSGTCEHVEVRRRSRAEWHVCGRCGAEFAIVPPPKLAEERQRGQRFERAMAAWNDLPAGSS